MKKVFLFLTMLLFAFTGTMKAELLTVHDGTTTNSYVPVYGFYADAYNKCEMVYPASDLSEMAGGTINGLTFYASQASVAWGSANFQVFVAEVADETISAFAGPGTVVYEGSLSIDDNMMVVTFDAPYNYGGGNLLIGFYQTATGSYVSSSWYGESVTGASVQGYSYSNLASVSPTQRNFLPKATFDYTVGGGGVPAELIVHEGTTTNSYVPVYGFYADAYNKCEMVYPATELSDMNGGTINSMTFYASQASVAWGSANFQVFVAEVADATISAFAGPGTIVYEGSLSIVDNEMVVNFTTPYNYNGGNLLVGVYQTATGSYVSSSWYGESVTGASVQGYSYSNLASVSPTQRNFLPKTKFDYVTGGGPVDPAFVINPENLELGYRPNGAWMAPYTFELSHVGGNINVYGFDAENGYFSVNAEVPFTLGAEPVLVEVTTGEGEDNTLQEGNVVVLYSDNRNAEIIPINAISYDPADGDVYELAIENAEFPAEVTAGEGIHKNYVLPIDGEYTADVVYEVTFDNDMLVSANTSNGVAFLYTQDFNGAEGPMADNNYVYNGPEQSPVSSFTEGFEGGLNGWSVLTVNADGGEWIHSDDNLGGYDYTTLAHTGTGFAMCYSYVDYVGAFNTNSYLITPRKYTIESGSTLSFWADNANDSYPESFTVCVATADNPTAADFTQVWSGSAKGNGNDKAEVRHNNNRYDNWRAHEIDLSAYAGQEVYIAFHDVNYDWYEVWIDDVELGVADRAVAEVEPSFTNMFVPAGTYYLVAASLDETFTVTMTAEAAPAPVQAIVTNPLDGATGVDNPCNAAWDLGMYTTEMQVLFGSVYPPTTELIPWTSDLVTGYTLPTLEHNRTYFIQVNERNGYAPDYQVTYGEIVGFTTVIDGVEGFTAESVELYPGDAAVFTWTANRSIKGYNLYQDGVKVNAAPITGLTYSVEDLAYNMTPGYAFQLTAVYDEGESEPTEAIMVQMTGTGFINGHVWEIDSITPVYNVTVDVIGFDEYGHEQILPVSVTNPSGYYEGEILTGIWMATGTKDGYQTINVNNPEYSSLSEPFELVNDATVDDIDIYMIEYWAPLGQIRATEEENDVLVEWSWDPAEMIVDFETGDFSQAEFTLPASYPWTITTTNPYEGTYCMKSTCEGVASGSSSIQATVEVPYDGKMGFWVKVSSEANYDKFHFYIDGVEQGAAMSGNLAYTHKEYAVTEGTHTYKWEYTKDSSVNSYDDCVYVDYITMYRQDTPVPGGQTYDFDDSTLQGWTVIDGGTPTGYAWDVASNTMSTGYGHDGSVDCALSKSYDNNYGVIYPDNYLVSPSKITAHNGAAIHFFACAQDASYAAEHFGVAVSTGSNNNASDFTTIQEWTMTAKSAQGNTADDAKPAMRGTRTQGNWYEYTVDLSSYNGQQIWVAIRHFNCSDQFYLLVDDITLSDGTAKRAEGDRTLTSFKLYRRNVDGYEAPYEDFPAEEIELIASPGLDVFSYIDNQWNDLPYGVYQWGIQAYYEGNHHYAEKGREVTLYDFEDGTLGGWTTVDADGDGIGWLVASDVMSTGYGHNASTDCVLSQSYSNTTGALNPDNYLVSPAKAKYSQISFWACAQDNAWASEHFGVAVSTGAGTTGSEFTTIQEWTMTAKSGAKGPRGMNTQGNWYQYTVDLSAYAGQDIWVALRHFNCSDWFYLDVDDIELTTAGGGGNQGGGSGTLVIDFETGDFSQYDFDNTSSYPWTVVSDNGSYVMKSGNGGVASSTSAISATVDYVVDGTVSFDALCMGEGSSTIWDKCQFFIDGTEKFCYGANQPGWNNYSYEVAQGTHLFTWSYTKDSSVNPSGDYMEVDNITFDGVAGGGGGATGGFGYSDILWSNIIEKDMVSNVKIIVALSNGQSPEGVEVALTGDNYEEMFEMDATGVLELELRKAVYEAAITFDGYTSVTDELVIDEDEEEFSYLLEEIVAPVEGLYVSPTGFAMWEGGANAGGGGGGGQGGNGDEFTVDFEDGLPEGWTTIDNGTPSGYGWTLGSLVMGTGYGHNGSSDCMVSKSYDNNYGVVYPDNYLVTPQVNIVAGSTFSFYACAQDASYAAEHYGVAISDNATGPWTMVEEWTMTAKEGPKGARGTNAQGNWYQKTVDLSSYAGQKYIAIRHFNCSDQFYLDVDDIQLSAGSKGNRTALSFIVMIDGVVEGDTEYGFFQHNVDEFEVGSVHYTSVRAVYASGNSDWTEPYEWTYASCEDYTGLVDKEGTAEVGEDGPVVHLSWTLPEGPEPPTPGEGHWYYYDNGVNEDAIGTGGGNFWWGIMVPAGSYEGNSVTKVAAYDYMAMTGTATIYNDGATAPAGSAVGTVNVTMTGSEDFVEYEFATPVTIDPTKNVWVVFYNGSGATYPAAVCANTGDANGRWVSLDGSTWEDLAGYGLSYTFMVRVFIETSAKGEVAAVTLPTQTGSNGTFSNAGVAKVQRTNRAMWDLVNEFDGTSGYQYGVATDGNFIYTSSWSASSTSMFYKYDLDGNFVEEFNVAGSGQIRDLTYDGEYFYGVANASTIYCLDLANHTLVGQTTSAYGAMRCCSYDPERDGFWVVGNWSGNLTLVDRTGAIVQVGPAPTSASGVAYYKDVDGVEHVYCFNNGDNGVYDYNITTNTLGTTAVFNFNTNPVVTGSAGGCHVAAYAGKTCFFGDIQQSPQHIAIYELDETVPPVPPTPTGDVIGVIIYRDGEFLAQVNAPTTSYTDIMVDWETTYEYCFRVIYSDYSMSCFECLEVTTDPDAVEENEVVNAIYPNPTKGELHINATAMTRISVYNAMGQMVLDQEVSGDEMVLNMAQFETGVYMVKVTTETGSSVKRINVVK